MIVETIGINHASFTTLSSRTISELTLNILERDMAKKRIIIKNMVEKTFMKTLKILVCKKIDVMIPNGFLEESSN